MGLLDLITPPGATKGHYLIPLISVRLYREWKKQHHSNRTVPIDRMCRLLIRLTVVLASVVPPLQATMVYGRCPFLKTTAFEPYLIRPFEGNRGEILPSFTL